MALVETVITLGILFYILYKWGTSTYDYWKKRGVKHIKPRIPFIGGCSDMIFKKRSPYDPVINKIYNLFPGERFGGWFKFQQPVLILRDIELIKKVLISDVEYFTNRGDTLNARSDPVLRKSLFCVHDQEWKVMRNIISRGFTTLKIKNMLTSINKCGEQMTNYLNEIFKRQLEENHSDKNLITLNFQQFFRRYTVDAMASITFDMEIDSLKDPENELNEMVEKCFLIAGWTKIKYYLFWLFPTLMRAIQFSYLGFDSKFMKFAKNRFHRNIKIREERNIFRNDLFQLLLSARKDLNDEDLTSQAILLFLFGSEGPSNALGFMVQELAENPEIQKRLQAEIDQIIEEENGITYEGIMHKMKYLDMVVNEALRKWPVSTTTNRKVGTSYKIPSTVNCAEVVLEKGDVVVIPIAALLNDPKYFPEPRKFNPERYSEENKHKIHPFLLLLPFGNGPRNCVGMRFAYMLIKATLVHLLYSYDLNIVSESKVPLELNNSRFQLTADNGIWLGVSPRK